jgi:hypothetical protein
MSSNNRRRGELDSNTAVELVPTAYTVQGSMDIYRLINDGGVEGRDVMASQQYSARQRYVSIKLENRLTKEIIFESNYTRFTDQNWDYKAKALVVGTLAFECLNWSSDGTQNQFSDTKPSDEKVDELSGPILAPFDGSGSGLP